jgi:hypothetical protein
MVVLVNGCSNTFGSETLGDCEWTCPSSPNHAYGSYISSLLKAEYVNLAYPGKNNLSIAYGIFEWIESNCIRSMKYNLKDLFVLVGWTESGRYKFKERDFYLSKFGAELYVANKGTDVFSISDHLKKIDPTKEFSRVFLENFPDSSDDVLTQIFTMLCFDLFMKKYSINYFTFPTLEIRNINSVKYKFLLNLLDQKHNYITKDTKFNLPQNFAAYLAKGLHLNYIGQRRLALWLYEEMCRRNILKDTCTSS